MGPGPVPQHLLGQWEPFRKVLGMGWGLRTGDWIERGGGEMPQRESGEKSPSLTLAGQ